MTAGTLRLTAAWVVCVCCGLLTVAGASAPALASTLPDGRVYEMVSPVDKNGGQIDGGVSLQMTAPQQAAEDGESIAFGSQSAFAGAEGGLETEQYLARRGADGWLTEPVTPRQEPPVSTEPLLQGALTNIVQASDAASLYQDFTPDLSHGFLVASDPAPVVGAPAGYFNPYERDSRDGSYRLLSSATPPVQPPGIGTSIIGHVFDVGFAGASADGSHVVFEATDAVTSDAVPGQYNIYEASGTELRLVSILPNGSPDPGERHRLKVGEGQRSIAAGNEEFDPFGGNFDHAVSADGSRIFWTGSDGQLYMREDGTHTVRISASQKTNGTGPGGTDANGPQEASYWTAGAEGSTVLFTSSEQLTNDSTAVSPNAEDLYRWHNTNNGEPAELTDLTVDHHAGDVNGAEVQGVLGASEDGSYVYFAAEGVLADGATLTAPPMANVYVWHDGAIRFIAKISAESESSAWEGFLRQRTSRVSPNGRYLAFESRERLTGYDNAGFNEVYEYDTATNRLTCASCNPSGARPMGDSVVPPLLVGFGGDGWQTLIRQQRYLLDDGRLFFDSRDALVPGDVNGATDVYEYENGRAFLISSGTGEAEKGIESQFVDASASGNDVFFVTRDQLVPEDTGEALDLYDARVGGGFPHVSSPACTGTGCQGVPPPPPVFATPASVTFSGAGNIVQRSPKPAVAPKGSTRARKLARALAACRHKPKRKRAACQAQARKRYGAKAARSTTRRRSSK